MKTKYTILSMLSIALFAFTFGGSFGNSIINGKNVASMLGAQVVGISVGVEPNEFTELAQQVSEKEQELELRELAVQEKEEQAVRAENIRFMSTEVYVTILAFILLILVLLNFYLDFRRNKVQLWQEPGK